MTNREIFCNEAIEFFGIKVGDELVMESDFSEYLKHNGKKVEVVRIIGAESSFDEVALPAYICKIDGEEIQLEGSELKDTLDKKKMDHVYRFFNDNGDFCHNSDLSDI